MRARRARERQHSRASVATRLARRRRVAASELAADAWVRAHDGSGARLVDHVLMRADLRPAILLAGRGDEPVEAQALVAAGKGVTIAHELGVIISDRIAVRPLTGGAPVRRVQAALMRGSSRPPRGPRSRPSGRRAGTPPQLSAPPPELSARRLEGAPYARCKGAWRSPVSSHAESRSKGPHDALPASYVAAEQLADRHADAIAFRAAAARRGDRSHRASDVVLRRSVAQDAAALARLAQLDGAPRPVGAVLVAELDGEIVAAVPVDGGRAIADPFRPTAELVELLRARTRQAARRRAACRACAPTCARASRRKGSCTRE